MEFLRMLVDFCGFVAEYAQVLYTIRKAMALFTILTPTIFSILYLPYLLLNNQTRESLSALEWIYLLIIAAPWSFSASATVAASAVAQSGANNLPLKDLLLWTLTTWKIALSTTASAALFCFFPFWFVILDISSLVLALDVLFHKNRDVIAFDATSVFVAVVGVLAYSYLSFVWMMGIVVCVLEGKGGVEAMKKGREVVKGTGVVMQGFMINSVAAMVALVVCVGMRTMMSTSEYQSEEIRVAIGLILLSCIGVAGLFGMVAHTIWYVKCKKTHGEEIEVLKSLGVGEEATLPLITPYLA